ncbi:MAG: 3D domain-containing protein [Defluviitaleaceae bacterium]|nr:3D domain-containing protein [Defluviitaleaceae bacterium]
MKKLKKALMTFSWVLVFLALTIAIPPATHHFFAGDTQLMQVMIYDQGQVHRHRTGADTVQDLLQELGIPLNQMDRTNHATHSPVWEGMNLIIFREVAFGVRINGEFASAQLILPGTTVGQVLVQHQLEHDLMLLYGGDLTRYVENGEIIDFSTWDSRFYTDHEVIPYETIENHTPQVWNGRSHTRQEGVPGEHEVTTAVVIIGGEERNRAVVGSNMVSEPICEIIDIGTAPLGALADVAAPDFHYMRRVRMEATAYTAGFNCTGKHPWDPWYRITASGREVEHGVVAVDRNVIPLGTRLYVEGYGFAIAADVGGAIRGYKIDLFMECINDARRFGRRHINVWILE